MSDWRAQGSFVSRKWPPYFGKSLTSDGCAQGFFVFQKDGLYIFGSPTRLTGMLKAVYLIFSDKWTLGFLPQKGILAYAREGMY